MLRYIYILFMVISCTGSIGNYNKFESHIGKESEFPYTLADTLWKDFHIAVASNNQEYLLSISQDSIDCIICEYFLETGKSFHNASFFYEDSTCREALLKYGPQGNLFEYYRSSESETEFLFTFINDPDCRSDCSITAFHFEKNDGKFLFTGCFLIP